MAGGAQAAWSGWAGPGDEMEAATPLHGMSSHRHTCPIKESQNRGEVELGLVFHVISARARRALGLGLQSAGGLPLPHSSLSRVLWGLSSWVTFKPKLKTHRLQGDDGGSISPPRIPGPQTELQRLCWCSRVIAPIT